MKPFIVILLTAVAFHSIGQETWYDYIAGKPNVDYVEAKKAITKEWGINYHPVISGCVYTPQMEKERDSFLVLNKPYLTKLDKEFGTHWQEMLNEDIQLFMFQQKVKGTVWKEPIFGRPNISYFNQKKKTLATLGIQYEPIFKNCSANNLNDADQEELDKSNAIRNTFYRFIGRGWESLINKKIKQSFYQNTDNTITWDEYFISKKVDKPYQIARSKILNDWGIQHRTHFINSCKYKKLKKEGTIEKSQADEATVTKNIGADWPDRLHVRTVQLLSKSI